MELLTTHQILAGGEIFDLQKMARRVARALHRRGWSANSRR